MKEIRIGKNESDQRVDRFLSKYFNGSSKGNIQKMIRKKVFRVNGKNAKANDMLKDGDLLTIYLSDESHDALIKEFKVEKTANVRLDIVFEDEDLLVVNKPAGLLTHPDKSEYKNTLATYVQQYLHEYVSRTFKPAPIHRLDKNTSGLIMFAKNYETLKRMNESMREREIEKYYLCVVEGHLSGEGEVKGFLRKDHDSNKVKLFNEQQDDSDKFCHTTYKAVKRLRNSTLVEVKLHTGRSHQIRVSMAYLGYPIVGDVKYGAKRGRTSNGQLLHAYRIVTKNHEFVKPSEDIENYIAKG